MSINSATKAGISVFASNIYNSLTKEISTDRRIKAYFNPFSVIGKVGFKRKIISLLRQAYNELIIFAGNNIDFYYFPSTEIPLSILLFKRKFGITVYDLAAWHNKGITTKYANFRMKLLPIAINRAEKIFTISQYSKKDISLTFKKDLSKIIVLEAGLKQDFLLQDKENNDEKFFTPELYLLNVGSLEPRKNIIFLINVFELLLESLNNNFKEKLMLVLTGGESWNFNPIKERIKNSPYKNKILILGMVESNFLPKLYKNAVAMVYPSIAEGFGIPVIESLSQGTPVYIQNNTSLTQFKDFGANVMDNFNEDERVKEIKKCIECKQRVDKDMIKKVKESFSWAYSAEKLIASI
ncbi:MAG: glycosyltransferase family 1 protein [bacterium]